MLRRLMCPRSYHPKLRRTRITSISRYPNSIKTSLQRAFSIYQLIITNNSHHAQWLQIKLHRVEGRPVTLIPENDIAMGTGIEIWDSVRPCSSFERSLSLAGGII